MSKETANPIVQGRTVAEKDTSHRTTTVYGGTFYDHHMARFDDDEHNRRNAGKRVQNDVIRQHNMNRGNFEMTQKLYLHKINHHQVIAWLGCIPLPIPLLCTIHGSVYYLYNEKGEVFNALVLDVLDGGFFCCQFCWHAKVELNELLKTHQYKYVSLEKGQCTVDHASNRIPGLLSSQFGCRESCIMCKSCVSVATYERK